MLTFHKTLTDGEKSLICNWKYDGEYAIYNLQPQHILMEKQQGIYNPENAENYYSFYDGATLVGYINLVERTNRFSVGIAVNPALCGQGYGRQMLDICCDIAKNICLGKPLGLQVRTWNKRAIKCYEKAGFEIIGEEYELTTPSGKGLFYKMVKE